MDAFTCNLLNSESKYLPLNVTLTSTVSEAVPALAVI